MQPGTASDLWAKDPFSSIEKRFEGRFFWAVLAAPVGGGMLSHFGGPIQPGGRPGSFDLGSLLLVLPHSRNINSCHGWETAVQNSGLQSTLATSAGPVPVPVS